MRKKDGLHATNETAGTMTKPAERTKTAPDDNGSSTTCQTEIAPCVDAML
jgi:hypothetical protein